MASIPAQEAVRLLISNLEVWSGNLRDVRNGLAHGLARQLGDIHELHVLYERTKYLLNLVLMSEIGMSDDVRIRAVRNNEYLMYLNRK